MYKDISRIEEMVSMYLVLDEEDQLEIQEKVFELYSKSIKRRSFGNNPVSQQSKNFQKMKSKQKSESGRLRE